MKKINKVIEAAFTEAGIPKDRTDLVIAAIKVSLIRQAAKEKGKKLIIKDATQHELEDSLRFGAELTHDQAKTVVLEIKKAVKKQKDSKVSFFDEGMFETKDEEVEFKSLF